MNALRNPYRGPSRARTLLLALVCLPAPGLAAAQITLLRHVNVVDLEQGRTVRDQALRIEAGRIAEIGPADALPVPDGARIVEGDGRFLLPGLCDMHIHLSEDHAADTLLLLLANGVTTAQCMSGSPWTLELRARLARGELPGPRLFTTGPTTGTLRIHTVEQAEAVVRAQQAAGYDAVKMYGDGSDTMPLETYRKLVETGHELGMRIVGHAPRNLPFAVVLEAHQDSIDHMEELVYTDEGLGKVVRPYVDLQFGRVRFEERAELLGEVPDFRPLLREEIDALAKQVRASGMSLTATLSTFGAIQESIGDGYSRMLAREELRYVPPTTRERWAPDQARFRNGLWKPRLLFMSRVLGRSYELQAELVRAFQAAGVPLMTGTDAPFDFVVPGFSLHGELERFVAAGLTPLEALRAATLNPARFRGLEDGSGTIRKGARADLVLVEADPLADIAATRRIAGVFQAGTWFGPEDLQQRLEDLAHRNVVMVGRMSRLRAALNSEDPRAAVALYREGGAESHLALWLEDLINERGYAQLRAKHLDEALALLRLNTEAFPGSANAWDSLGEVCMEREELEEALHAYEHSLELDGENRNAQTAVDRIIARLADSSGH